MQAERMPQWAHWVSREQITFVKLHLTGLMHGALLEAGLPGKGFGEPGAVLQSSTPCPLPCPCSGDHRARRGEGGTAGQMGWWDRLGSAWTGGLLLMYRGAAFFCQESRFCCADPSAVRAGWGQRWAQSKWGWVGEPQQHCAEQETKCPAVKGRWGLKSLPLALLSPSFAAFQRQGFCHGSAPSSRELPILKKKKKWWKFPYKIRHPLNVHAPDLWPK